MKACGGQKNRFKICSTTNDQAKGLFSRSAQKNGQNRIWTTWKTRSALASSQFKMTVLSVVTGFLYRLRTQTIIRQKVYCSEIQGYQNVIDHGGHPVALVSIVTTLCERVYPPWIPSPDSSFSTLFTAVLQENTWIHWCSDRSWTIPLLNAQWHTAQKCGQRQGIELWMREVRDYNKKKLNRKKMKLDWYIFLLSTFARDKNRDRSAWPVRSSRYKVYLCCALRKR